MKIKAYSGIKIDPDGEVYKFKNGKAKVPGFAIKKNPVEISLKEFNDLILEITNQPQRKSL